MVADKIWRGYPGSDHAPGYHGDGQSPAGRTAYFAGLARPDLNLWPRNIWNPWLASTCPFTGVESVLSPKLRDTGPLKRPPAGCSPSETGAKPSGTVGPRRPVERTGIMTSLHLMIAVAQPTVVGGWTDAGACSLTALRSSMTEPLFREPELVRKDCGRKLFPIETTETNGILAILSCPLGEDWVTELTWRIPMAKHRRQVACWWGGGSRAAPMSHLLVVEQVAPIRRPWFVRDAACHAIGMEAPC